MVAEFVMYRLSFDTINSNYAAECEHKLGEGCWRTINFDHLRWHTVRRKSMEYLDVVNEYKQLRSLELARSAPVRNVKLEKTVMQEPIWEEVRV